MKKFPKIKRIGDERNAGILTTGDILVQEKLDGANFRFTYDSDEGRLVFGSRRMVWWNEKDTAKAFKHAVEFVREQIDLDALHKYREEDAETASTVVLFGEAMHPHTLDYDWDNVPSFIGFDVWDDDIGFWRAADGAFRDLNLPTAPEIYRGPAEDFEYGEDYEVPQSEYRDGKAEGVVIKNRDTGQRAKVRSPEFLEVHKPNTTDDENVEDEQPDYEILAEQFATESRIKKHIYKMRNEGRTVEMEMMEDLWRRVFEDIIEEEYDEILLGNYFLDTKQFRSEVAGRAANVLEAFLARPDGSVLNEVHS